MVGALIFAELVDTIARALLFDGDGGTGNGYNFPIRLGNHNLTGVNRCMAFHTRRNEWNFGANERNGLRHHVRTHERAVGIIMFMPPPPPVAVNAPEPENPARPRLVMPPISQTAPPDAGTE